MSRNVFLLDPAAPRSGAELTEDLVAEITQNRAAVPAEPGLKPWGAGHMYAGGADKAHIAYLHGYFDAQAAKASPSDRRKILAFKALQAREGSTAAINTYDNQIVTWGTGWGGLGWLGKVMARATASCAVREALGAAGVRHCGGNVYDVVDLDAGTVVTGGKEALEIMRRSVPLLHLLIDLARNPATRDAVTEAQLRTFMEGSGNISCADAIATQALFNLIAHLKHWAPGYATGCLEWAVPQAGDGPSAERDKRLAALVGRYFYGKARKYKWIPDWKQLQLYWKHMKEDGLDCLDDPFIKAAGPPADDPFAAVPVTAPAAAPPPKDRGALRRGAKGPDVKALQEALIALGANVPGGADGAFGPGLEAAVKEFQAKHGLTADGVVGAGTLAAIDAARGPRVAT